VAAARPAGRRCRSIADARRRSAANAGSVTLTADVGGRLSTESLLEWHGDWLMVLECRRGTRCHRRLYSLTLTLTLTLCREVIDRQRRSL